MRLALRGLPDGRVRNGLLVPENKRPFSPEGVIPRELNKRPSFAHCRRLNQKYRCPGYLQPVRTVMSSNI